MKILFFISLKIQNIYNLVNLFTKKINENLLKSVSYIFLKFDGSINVKV
jgi:hypothetical protein